MINILLALLPSFLHVRIRKLLGAKIGKGTKIRFGSIIRVSSKKIEIGNNVKIGPLTYVAARELQIKDYSIVKPLVFLSTAYIKLSEFGHIAPTAIIRSSFSDRSRFELGKHSRVFPYCWIDTGEGVFIGDEVGIGGHTLIFTHGSWPNYIEGGPVSFGEVRIGNNVWIPWRVFILPNITIGDNAVIGANSTVNKSLPANVLAAGSPAKILKEDIHSQLSEEDKEQKAVEVITDYANHLKESEGITFTASENEVALNNWKVVINNKTEAKQGDLVFYTKSNVSESEIKTLTANRIAIVDHHNRLYYNKQYNSKLEDFVFYVRKFGVRLEYCED